MTKQMRFPAPRRCSQEQEGGTYYTKAWEIHEVIDYKLAGGWFQKGHHDFADRAAAKAAGAGDE